jgi:hypothetical protein
MRDGGEGRGTVRRHQGMNMVWHDNICAENIAHSVKVPKSRSNGRRVRGIAKHAASISRIQIMFDSIKCIGAVQAPQFFKKTRVQKQYDAPA